jgi:hypothetical protein
MTFTQHVINFNTHLHWTGGALPPGIRILNPFQESPQALRISQEFYTKYCNDNRKRHIILGINPGRFGGGLTGIPFTDPKRLRQECGILYDGKDTHETSSVFVYEAINAFGGPEAFYQQFYINSICPLGFTTVDNKGREKNYNYYDSKQLTDASYDFVVETLKQQLSFGIRTDVGFCFGTGKNEKFLKALNDKYHFFDRIVALEHPRFIMQYKTASKQFYIDKYMQAFEAVLSEK